MEGLGLEDVSNGSCCENVDGAGCGEGGSKQGRKRKVE